MVETTQVNEGSNLAFQTISYKRKLLHKILKARQDLITIWSHHQHHLQVFQARFCKMKKKSQEVWLWLLLPGPTYMTPSCHPLWHKNLPFDCSQRWYIMLNSSSLSSFRVITLIHLLMFMVYCHVNAMLPEVLTFDILWRYFQAQLPLRQFLSS